MKEPDQSVQGTVRQTRRLIWWYMKIDGEEIMSTSPETLVRLKNRRLTTFPVAGSRPRGRTEEEDEKLSEELINDEKELAEHNMLVDLGRNDLGRISEFGSVEVTASDDSQNIQDHAHLFPGGREYPGRI